MLQRRSLLRLAALTGLSLSVPLPARRAGAAGEKYEGPYYIMINAGGGWDPRFLLDPTLEPDQNRLYSTVEQVGNIEYAPIAIDPTTMDIDEESGAADYLLTAQTFLERHGSRLLVVNGVDMETNNHDAGNRAIWSGRLQEGYPSIGALIAAARTPDKPMAFLSSAGYDATEGLVPLTRVSSADNMQKIAYPNQLEPGDSDNNETYHGPKTWSLAKQLQAERLEEMKKKQHVPRLKQSMADLQLARARDEDLRSLQLPEQLVDAPYYDGGLQRSMQQAQIGVAAFNAGIAASLNVGIDGFDTHGNHDADQPARIFELLTLIDFVVAEVEAAGLSDRTRILIGSDFARGPFYNSERDNAGKDHWPIGSFMALGAGIAGDRVIGGTTADQLALPVDSETLETSDSGGTKITYQEIHRAIRAHAGEDIVELGEQFPLAGPVLPLFS